MADPPVKAVETGPARDLEIVLATDPRPILRKTRAPVLADVDGCRFRSTVAAMNGGWFVPSGKRHRTAAALDPARTYPVTLDTDPRTVAAPEGLAAAIRAAGLEAARSKRSYTRARAHAEATGSAKRADTRNRRTAARVDELAGGRW